MNTNRIVEFVKRNKLAESIFMSFALRQRNRQMLNLETFRKVLEESGVSVNTQEFIDIFKYLVSENIGQLVVNRSGLFFKSFIPLRGLGFLGLNEKPFDSGETRDRTSIKMPIQILGGNYNNHKPH